MTGPASNIRSGAGFFLSALLAVPLSLVFALIAGFAAACSFHAQLPDKTAGDYLAASSVVVLAREDPENQWAYRPVEALKGDARNLKIDVFIPSATRRRLANNNDDTVLLAYSPDEGTWRKLAYVPSKERALYERMVSNSESWNQPEGRGARFHFFAELHDHPDKAVRQLALTELDRADYRDLRRMEIKLSFDMLARDLWQPVEQPWAPIRIMMIGIRNNPEGRALVLKSIMAAEATGWSMHLGAWATALVEMEGAAGLERLRSGFLMRRDRSQQQIEAVLIALAIHGAGGDPDIGASIDAALTALVTERPEFVATIARIFGAQGDYSRAALLSAALEKRKLKSPADVITVATYLSLARQSVTK